MRPRFLMVLCTAAVTFTACADDPVGPPPAPAESPPESTPSSRAETGVATLGILLERTGSSLVLEQQELEFTPASRGKARSARQELSIGRRGGSLRVTTDASTEIYVKGARVASLQDIPLRTQLLVSGTRTGTSMKAMLVTDLSGAGPPTAAHNFATDEVPRSVRTRSIDPSFAAAATTSLCIGQDMDYTDANVHEFHGCWGGPVVSDDWEIPNIPFFCPVVGCFVLDRVSFTFALGGWIFDWPFRFTATSPGLTYHVPGEVSVNVAPLPALGTAFTFTGGLGFDYGLNVDFCTLNLELEVVCADLGTFHLSILSMIHQTTLAGPLKSTQRLEIAEVGCPSVGVLVIPNVPIDPLALGLCEDLDLVGRAFSTNVTAEGTSPSVTEIRSFDGAAQTLAVRPDAATVSVSYSEFSWAPEMEVAFFFRLKSFGITLWDSPGVPITGGSWPAVSTPFPGTDFTVATDPESPISNPSYLFQPTVAAVASFPVAPAPTQLAILSSATLAEGSPVTARLTESFDGSPISGVQLRFIVTTAGVIQQTFATTNFNGVAQVTLPNGEHSVVVQFLGSEFYLPSSAAQSPVWVYLPTMFVIWGGNAEGIVAGQRYNFWGAQWHKQVTGGAYSADGSFKGHAFSVSGSSWIGAPGNAILPPAQLAQYVGVIVATETALDGVNTVGDVAARVILRVEDPASYQLDPGHAAWGVMTTQIAPAGVTVAAGG